MKNLTQREIEILLLIATGSQTKDMVEELYRSKHTIKNHKSNMIKKLSLKGTNDLLLFAIKNELLLRELYNEQAEINLA